jgi:hypothetical protein
MQYLPEQIEASNILSFNRNILANYAGRAYSVVAQYFYPVIRAASWSGGVWHHRIPFNSADFFVIQFGQDVVGV